ncbi:MAG: outer membrane protein assembly factor BamB [Betaproteobacteria bacterium]
MRLLPGALLAATLLAVGGCSSWNPLVAMGIRSEPAHKPTPLAPINATVTPRAAWSANVGKSGGFAFRPQLEGDRVYAAAADGAVSVLDAESGRQVARYDTKKKLSAGVTVGEGRIVLGTLKGEVIVLDAANGNPAWSTSVAGEVIAPAAITRQSVIVRTSDGRIFGLAPADGKRQWVFQRPTPALLLRSEAGVLVSGGDVVAGYPNGKLIALDLDDGKLTWEVTVSQPHGTTELERIADVAGLPVIESGTICAGAYQGKIACFDIQTRNMVWSRDVSTPTGLARGAKHVYAVDDTGAVHALDKATGTSVWKQDKLQYRKLSAPVVVSGYVVVGDLQGYIHVLSPDDGSIVGRLATDGTAVEELVPVTDGVLVQTAGGIVSRLRF